MSQPLPFHPGGFLLVWADSETDQNRADRVDLHVNFRLAQAGEDIGLFAPDGTEVSAITFGAQTADVSEGRYLDGAAPRYFMTTPTPRAANRIQTVNHAPVLALIPDRFIHLGETLNFTADAVDPDVPPQMLNYSFDGAVPPFATLSPDGAFAWTPVASQAPSTNAITLRVTDNGDPALSDSQTFTVVVAEAPFVGDFMLLNGAKVQFALSTMPGRRYQVFYRDELSVGEWLPMGSAITATGYETMVTAERGTGPQRFFLIRLLP